MNKKVLVFLVVFSAALIVYLPLKIPSSPQNGDNMWYIPSVISLLTEQNLDIDEYTNRIHEVNGYAVREANGNKYNYFPYGTVLLNYPLTLITQHFFDCSFTTEAQKIECSEKIADINAKIFASASVGMLFLVLLKLTSSLRQSFLLSFVFAFASPHFSNHAGGLWSHNISVFLITVTLFLMLYRGKISSLSAIPLAFSYITRPTMALSVLFLTFYYYLSNHFSDFIKFVFIGMGIALLFVLYNISIYDSFLPPYYQASRLSFEHFSEAALGHLFSPNRGLFVFFPLAIFSVIGGYLAIKNRENYLYRILFVGLILYYLVYSMFPHWWMGGSYGPRIFAELVPYLVILMVPSLKLVNRFTALKIIFGLFLIYSVFVQMMGVLSWKSYGEWNALPINVDAEPARIWSWRDNQILRGFTDESYYYRSSLSSFASKIERVDNIPIVADSNTTLNVPLRVTNLGHETWSSQGDAKGRYMVNLSYHIERHDGSVLLADGIRTSLPHDVVGGVSVPLDLVIKADFPTGHYVIKADMVQEGVAWFGQKNADGVLSIPLEIK